MTEVKKMEQKTLEPRTEDGNYKGDQAADIERIKTERDEFGKKLARICRFVGDDSLAASYQTTGQYRSAILKMISDDTTATDTAEQIRRTNASKQMGYARYLASLTTTRRNDLLAAMKPPLRETMRGLVRECIASRVARYDDDVKHLYLERLRNTKRMEYNAMLPMVNAKQEHNQ